ncbi:MAG TPA: DUF2188 domain-containing protein [Myxococcota bacterium]|nr:DUF2188 domain-containing protein [Myxococcota bacterium]
MKLDFNQFPVMKNLTEDVKKKALEYAETLGARGPRPTTVLGTAVTLANEWKSGRLPSRPVAAPFLVQPRNGRWVIKRSNSELASHVYMRKDDAVRRAQELAKVEGAACFVFGPGGTRIERYEARAIAQMDFPQEETGAVKSEAVAAVEVAPVVEAVVAAEVAPVVEAVEAEVAPVVEAVEAEVAPVVEVVTMEAAVEELEAPAVIDPDETPIRVKRVANKWLVLMGDGRSESLPTKAKAVKRAQELAKKLGRAVVV